MRLAEYLDKQLLLPDLAAGTKREAFITLVQRVSEVFPEFDSEQALRVLEERESLGTTGIGEGIAIPHCKVKDLSRLIVVVARSKNGVPFDALDQKPCHFIFLVLAPEGGAGLHLRILARISRLARDQAFCGAMFEAPDANALWMILSGA